MIQTACAMASLSNGSSTVFSLRIQSVTVKVTEKCKEDSSGIVIPYDTNMHCCLPFLAIDSSTIS